ncbi:MAG TPA: TolC family protein, partial [Planctomycetota bacterium]|nr:TolC family protein [Planctomycetota bacterium]
GRAVAKPDGTRKITINLVEAIRLALANNQGFLSSTEGLDLQLLSLEATRRSWWPLPSELSGSVGWADSKGSTGSSSESLGVGVSQKLPWGATASVSAGQSGSQGLGPNSYSSSASAGISVPILRGGGWRLGIEGTVAAERGYVYARRNYAYNRTKLCVDTVESYFRQLQQQDIIRNSERNLERAKMGLRQAELLYRLARTSQTDVFRAEINVSLAEDALTNAKDQARIARDAFKLDLGLRPEDELNLEEEKLEHHPLAVDPEEAIAAVFKSNPFWLNAKDGFDDAGRALEFARNASLPSFNVGAGYSWSFEPTSRPFENFQLSSEGYSASASFSMPLDRLDINRSYQAAVISYRAAERGFRRSRDQFARDTQSLISAVKQAEANMVNQQRAIKNAERLVLLNTYEYRRGRIKNRDVIESQDQLLAAQNAYQAALVSAKISQLRLFQWIGRLEPDDEGRWFK